MTIYLFATLDTKGIEAGFLRDCLVAAGLDVKLVDVGSLGEPRVTPDVPRSAVFEAAGRSLVEIVATGDRGAAVTAAAAGAAELARRWHNQGLVSGVIALGGSAGTTIGTAAMRALPLGVPKVMVSTLASGQVRHWVQDKDVAMFNSVVDISGLNRISRPILTNAALAMAGMVGGVGGMQPARAHAAGSSSDRPLVAATMFGVTTPAVEHARKILEQAGYEVLVFHATGNGGQAMESLIDEGLIAGVLDLTTTELADELVGGILTAGPDRLTAAARRGIPQVVSVGAVDMVNFGPRDTVPDRFANRRFHQHNASVTLMRTTPEENAELGRIIAQKVSASSGPVAVMLPLLGVSAIDKAGQSFDDPAARAALFDGIRKHLSGHVKLVELNHHINDEAFAAAAANELIAMLQAAKPTV